MKKTRIGGVMVSVLGSSAVDRSCVRAPDQIKPKTIKLVFAASPLFLSTQHQGERAKTGWFGIGIMYPSETIASVS
jgi:hypothetical protein